MSWFEIISLLLLFGAIYNSGQTYNEVVALKKKLNEQGWKMDLMLTINITFAIIMWIVVFMQIYSIKKHGWIQKKSTQNKKLKLTFGTILFIIVFFPLSLFIFCGREI